MGRPQKRSFYAFPCLLLSTFGITVSPADVCSFVVLSQCCMSNIIKAQQPVLMKCNTTVVCLVQ